jgi:hypothetical protein
MQVQDLVLLNGRVGGANNHKYTYTAKRGRGGSSSPDLCVVPAANTRRGKGWCSCTWAPTCILTLTTACYSCHASCGLALTRQLAARSLVLWHCPVTGTSRLWEQPRPPGCCLVSSMVAPTLHTCSHA